MKQRNKMGICDMTHDNWIYFEENYVQKIKKMRKQVKKWWWNKQQWGCEHTTQNGLEQGYFNFFGQTIYYTSVCRDPEIFLYKPK